jgi:ABC-type dipeptide/oligopeptide/nickel transport system permease subunit
MATVVQRAVPIPPPSPAFEELRPRRAVRGFWARYRSNRAAIVGLAILLTFLVLAAAAPLVTPYDPEQTNLNDVSLDASLAHPLGTDHLGRDILARILYGARYSLLIGFAAVALGVMVGVPLGCVSGFYGGWVDLTLQRVIDVLLSFPGFLLAVSCIAVLGVGLENVIIAVAIGLVPAVVRLVRAGTLSIRRRTFVEAARGLGASNRMIIFHHVLPNALPPVIVQATLGLGATLLTAAGLGFLGLGVQQPTPEWGAMLGEGRQYIFSNPNVATFPGIAIFLTVLGFNLAGDGLRDALDPRNP